MVKFVAMATPEDLKVGAEYIKLADAYEEVPGGKNNRNYANVEVIVDVAQRHSCDAVWAGWGHASEFPTLPSTLAQHNLIFLGPGATAMRDLGDKIASSILAQSANVPTIPWSGDGVTVDYKKEGIPQEKFDQSCVKTVDEALQVVERIGLPVMIKASEGGGGKGIRKVEQMDQLAPSFSRVQAEVPGSPIFLMKMGTKCRHLEVQILGDESGNALALYGRDCSVQRRHQKIIEEGPVVVADHKLRREMELAAVRLAKEVGYIGAGTIEYLFTDGKYYFLELNPRLQVEHPVTELISDVNLPACQLCIGMGLRLDMIPHIRAMYQHDPDASDHIDFEKQEPRAPKGHVIACRITAENPLKGFQPTSGNIQELNFRSIPNVWGYFSVSSGGAVHEFADSQIGHLFAWGPDRDTCRNTIILGLKELSIRGDISTPVDYLIRLMETPEFRNNTLDTSWLDGLIAGTPSSMVRSHEEDSTVVICGAVFQAYRKINDNKKEFTKQLAAGRVPAKPLLEISHRSVILYADTEYHFVVKACGPESFCFELLPATPSAPKSHGKVIVEVRPFADGSLLIIFDGKSRTCYLQNNPPIGFKLIIDKKQHILEQQRDPTKIFTPSNGKIIKYLVPNGSHVKAGTAFVECEIMKMILPLVCDVDGVLTFSHAEGTVVETGELIARVEPDDMSSIRKAKPYKGTFPEMAPPMAPETKPHLRLSELQKSVDRVIQGYYHPDVPSLATNYLSALHNPMVPHSIFSKSMSEHKAALPLALRNKMEAVLAAYLKEVQGGKLIPFPANEMESLIKEHSDKLTDADRSTFNVNISGLSSTLLELGNYNPAEPEVLTIMELLQTYIRVEDTFDGRPLEVSLIELRETHKSDLDEVYRVCISFFSDTFKVELLAELLTQLSKKHRTAHYKDVLRRFYVLPKPRHVRLSLCAGNVLSKQDKLTPDARMTLLKQQLGALADGDQVAEEVLQSQVMDILTRLAHPLDLLQCVMSSFPERKRLVGACMSQYISLLIGSLPFQQSHVKFSESSPKVSFQWSTAPVDVGDQGLPGAGLKPTVTPAVKTSESPMKRTPSALELDVPASEVLRSHTGPSASRYSLACVFQTMKEAEEALGDVLAGYEAPNDATTRNILLLIVLDGSDVAPSTVTSPRTEDSTSTVDAEASGKSVQAIIKEHSKKLLERRIVRATVILGRFPHSPFFHSYRLRHGFDEDPLYRNFVPELGFLLELRRLDRYELELCNTSTARVLIYRGLERLSDNSNRLASTKERRLFVRAFVNIVGAQSLEQQGEADWSISAFKEYMVKYKPEIDKTLKTIDTPEQGQKVLRLLREVESVFIECLNALEVTISSSRSTPSSSNSLFLAVMTPLNISDKMVEAVIPFFMKSFGERIYALNINLLEFVLNAPRNEKELHEARRFVITNNSGVLWRVYSATESRSLSLGVPSPRLELHGSQPVETIPSSETQYVPNAKVSRRRLHCRNLGTTYVYDLLDVLERALIGTWREEKKNHGSGVAFPKVMFNAVEYRLDDKDNMVAVDKSEPGSNTIGMLAWKITLHTPEYPDGRDMVLIANDVSFEGGSFGPQEDLLYTRASEMARKLGIPRVYVSANAGARIGVATELMKEFNVAWVDPLDCSKGFEYLYVTPKQAKDLTGFIKCTPVEGQPDRMRITDIIGKKHGIGVENLQGSGLIAGETALAYRETFTLTMVTGRSVGIGAYVTRLGQRVIQNQGPILLTGYDALNRLLGREVYISHTQMGGPYIMYRNGVSHVDVNSDLEAFRSTLRWLSFIPNRMGAPLPIHVCQDKSLEDPLSRTVDWSPEPSLAYDPRHLLEGQMKDGKWIGGFFDKGSFFETLGGWARTVVTGRARLGGVPVGVIAVETRSIQKVIPADPASEESTEQTIQQAGQVWYPDSSFKTAQAIQDFNTGEQLPLFIFANWRGFSGGVSDMFNEVLKFGSMIVEVLSVYKQPVFVYLPPFSELRGGSWAVIDPHVNPFGMIEMYSSESAQGGILESTGTVSIKFRHKEQVQLMIRLDETMQELNAKKAKLEKTASNAKGEAAAIAKHEIELVTQKMTERSEQLGKVYHSIALRFCELHDTPGRMLQKKVISGIIPWKTSREFFGHRLFRRILECETKKFEDTLSKEEIESVTFQGFSGDKSNDVDVSVFLKEKRDTILRHLDALRKRKQVQAVSDMLQDSLSQGDSSMVEVLLKGLKPEGLESLSKLLAKK